MTNQLQRILFLLLFHFTSFSQQKSIRYTTTNGLPHDVCYTVFQDSKGFIWIATDNGLTKFDGIDFKTYTTNDGLSSNYVIDIKELSKGELAIGTWRGGLNIFDPKEDSFFSNKRGPNKLSNIEVHRDTIYNLHDAVNNTLWIEEDTIINFRVTSVHDAKNGHPILKYKTINDTLFGISSHLLKSPIKGVLFKSNGTLKPTFPFLDSYVLTDIIKLDATIYIASTYSKLLFFNSEGIIRVQDVKVPENNTIDKVLLWNKEKIIIRTTDETGFKYAYTLNLETGDLLDLRKKYGIYATISDVFIDNEKNLWIASYGDGVYLIKNFELNVKHIKLEKNPVDIEFNQSKAYALLNDRVSILDNNSIIDEVPLKGYAKDILFKDDEILVTSLDIKEKILHNQNIKEVYGYRYFKNKTFGDILINDSIRLLDKGVSTPYYKHTYNLFNAFDFKEKLYFTSNIGLFIFKDNKVVKDNYINKKIGNSNLKGAAVIEDTLFLGSQEGLLKIYDDKVIKYTTSNGIVNSSINDLFVDHKNQLWIATQNGISIYNNNHFSNLNQDSGLNSSFATAIKEDGDNKIWIVGNNGVNIIDNNFTIPKSDPPLLLINKEKLSFDYTVISYNRNSVLTAYKINNQNWTTIDSKKGQLDFSPFKPGNYTIQFRAKKLDSGWSPIKSYSFKIELPWHKKWWVVSLIVLLSAFITISFILNRLRVSRKINKALKTAIDNKEKLESKLVAVRDNIAKDFHDDLGNKLARISIFSALLNDENSSIDNDDKELIRQIETDANYLYKGTKDFIFSLKSESDCLEEVITYLSDFGEDYFKQFNIIFEVEKDIKAPLTLPYYWSKQVIFIFKEAMTNSVKHSKCKKVKLSFKYDNHILVIMFYDDGIGFEERLIKNTSGLTNMKTRAKTIHCDLIIKSNKDAGTKITFTGKPHQ